MNYNLPSIINHQINKHIKLECNDNFDIVISKSIYYYLTKIKKQMIKYEDWNTYVKYSNPYESIINNSIGKLLMPRECFKYIEIIKLFDLQKLSTFFHLSQSTSTIENVMTFFNKEYSALNPNQITLDINTLNYCHENYKMDLIIADDMFELNDSIKLYWYLCYAIGMQATNGCFVLKVFDIFTQPMLDIIYILSCCYEKVHLIKPMASNCSESEKYIVCIQFKQVDIYDALYSQLDKITGHIHRIVDFDLPIILIDKIDELNLIYGKQQVLNINYTINLINNQTNEKIETVIARNNDKCINWCKKFKIPFNDSKKTMHSRWMD